MNIDTAFSRAARLAENTTNNVMKKYATSYVTDEDDITGVLIGALDGAFQGFGSGMSWTSSILRHRKGIAAEEAKYGADMLLHFTLNTYQHSLSKGVLVQAKRKERYNPLAKAEKKALNEQCRKMLKHTPASYVFNYSQSDMRCGAANRVLNSKSYNIFDDCTLTTYRFFYEFFRSPIGDSKFTSALVKDIPVPNTLSLSATFEV